MSEPWFQPKGILRYRSITWQGRAVMWAIGSAMGLAFVVSFFVELESSIGRAIAAFGLVSFLIGHAIVLWKMDWGYDRRSSPLSTPN